LCIGIGRYNVNVFVTRVPGGRYGVPDPDEVVKLVLDGQTLVEDSPYCFKCMSAVCLQQILAILTRFARLRTFGTPPEPASLSLMKGPP
jgi:hypothetical protein